MTTIDILHLRNSVAALAAVSKRYAPNVKNPFHQIKQIREELREVQDELYIAKLPNLTPSAIEAADVVIAAVRLGTMLSDDFAKVIADKCAELDGRDAI